MPWAIRWSSNSALGEKDHLIGGARFQRPPEFGGYSVMVFATRREARAHVEKNYGYIRHRPDLHAQPHGWSVPKVVRVRVSVAEAA